MQRGSTNARATRVASVVVPAIAILIVSAGVLSGCAAAPAPPPTTVFVTVEPEPTPTQTPLPTSTVTVDPVAPAPDPSPNAPAPVVEWGPATDLGSTPGASGPGVSDANGQMLTYTVVSGDSFFDIAQRFDLPQQQLLRMNPQIHDFGESIYIGQVLNLDWTKTG